MIFVRGTMLTIGVTLLGAWAAQAQRPPAQPSAPAARRATVVVPAGESNVEVSLTIQGANAQKYLAVKAANADVREVIKEMGVRAGTPVVIAPSAAGRVTADLESQPVDNAMQAVAQRAGLSVVRIVAEPGRAALLTPDGAGLMAEALSAFSAGTVITDPATGRSLSLVDRQASEAIPDGYTTVYYLRGTLTPEQERQARERRVAEQTTQAAAEQRTVDPKQADAVGSAVQMLGRLPAQQRVEALRNMQRELFNSLSPEERRAMWGNRGQGNRGDRRGRR